jgi:hypothetical protein
LEWPHFPQAPLILYKFRVLLAALNFPERAIYGLGTELTQARSFLFNPVRRCGNLVSQLAMIVEQAAAF